MWPLHPPPLLERAPSPTPRVGLCAEGGKRSHFSFLTRKPRPAHYCSQSFHLHQGHGPFSFETNLRLGTVRMLELPSPSWVFRAAVAPRPPRFAPVLRALLARHIPAPPMQPRPPCCVWVDTWWRTRGGRFWSMMHVIESSPMIPSFVTLGQLGSAWELNGQGTPGNGAPSAQTKHLPATQCRHEEGARKPGWRQPR